MTKSESATRVSPGAVVAPLTLADAAIGSRLRIAHVGGLEATALRQEGLVPGALVTVERRLALGGPVILLLGSVRLAVARRALRGVRVEPAS